MQSATQGNCEWLFECDKSQNWTNSGQGLFCIKAHPGSGKSTMIKYLHEKCLSTAQHGLVLSFYFHGRGTELQEKSFGLFRSLLRQKLPPFPHHFSEFLQDYKERIEMNSRLEPRERNPLWDANELQRHLATGLTSVRNDTTIHIFVDALDECGEEKARKLGDLFRQRTS